MEGHDEAETSFEVTSALLGVQIRTDGSGLHKVFDSHGGLANHPHFSPDREAIVFTSDFAGTVPPIHLPVPLAESYVLSAYRRCRDEGCKMMIWIVKHSGHDAN